MKTFLFILTILPAILAGDFTPETLSQTEQDSILAAGIQKTKVESKEDVCLRYRLESENEEQIFRRSRIADWFIYDTLRHTRKQLGAGLQLGKVRDAVMSPNGRYVAFAKDNNLYIHKLDYGTEVAVSKNENTDIISGVADWLYEEEFGTTALFAWSPDSKQLAFVRLDESQVPAFSWQNYLQSPLANDSYPQYPTSDTLRYPKAGCANARASVCVYDVATKAIQTMQLNNEQAYFPRLRWHNDVLLVLCINRDQNKMEVMACNPKSTVSHPLYEENSKKYFIDYSLFDEWQWLRDGRFIVLSEQDGYPVQLTSGEGMHSARFSKDAKRMIDCFQSFDTPNTYSLYAIKGQKASFIETVLDNTRIQTEWKAARLPEPQLLRIPNANGQELEAMLLLPSATNPSPLVVMHYSGPQSQRVLNRWRKRFEYALVEAGYAVLIVDSRGSDCRGREWRNETYMNLGSKEAQDLIAAANFIGRRNDIDADRMAILGWSYGGYQTLMTMSTKDHPFKAGVAIAPVTDWRLYDSAYTERYMRRPQVNEYGYRNASLLTHANDLSGNVLIIHGTADDNVHVQHTMQYIDALVRANKQFEMQLYPDDNHFLKKGNNATHMHNRVFLFLKKNL